ncbi:MAG: fibrobacter succinogenes major paralogous domain-containing protein [Clostridia bacterium]|nr:fibrobacter succinogenes major paralogous domain-containing protein [Clostridia bacterium]
MKTFILSLLVLLSINAMSQLVVSTNMPCKLNLDFTEEYKLIPYYKKKISLTNGEHYIQAKSIDGGLSWDTVINVVNNKTVELQIDLHKVIPIVANILFISNENCTLNVNQDTTITLETDIGLKLNLPEGEYIINAFNTIGNEWQSTLNIVDNTQKVIKINFNNYDNTESIETYKQPTKQKQESSEYGSFTDPRDGKTYKTVKIGNQVWMAENLAYLPSVVGHGTESESTPYYYVYGYDGTNVTDAKATSNYTTYGVLYNWPAAMAGSASSNANPSGVQGVCPAGWHLPSHAEWTELTDYLGGESGAGGKLKETGTTHWASPNTGATNETGFTALPGGLRGSNGCFFNFIGYYGYWWSASEDGTYFAWCRGMDYYDSDVFRIFFDKEVGFSVRCVRD